MEWSMICRICLQEGDLISIFEIDDTTNLTFCEKIMQCSTINVRNTNLLLFLKLYFNRNYIFIDFTWIKFTGTNMYVMSFRFGNKL